MIRIINSDVLKWCRNFKGEKFHALLCDPPYNLNFMEKDWDRSGIAFNPATWKALAEHLHDGALIFVFASSRGYHRVACAMEDARLVIHPSLFVWLNATGYPKATKINTKISKADIKAWENHRYGRMALKPSCEPIIVAQKRYVGIKPVKCMNRTGAGAFNIDGARIGTGRHPSSFILQHHPSCRSLKKDKWECVEECPIRKLDEQSGNRISNRTYTKNGKYKNTGNGEIRHWNVDYDKLNKYAGEEGGASRFFYNSDWADEVTEGVLNADHVFYCPKANKNERSEGMGDLKNHHPTLKPIKLTSHLASLLLPPDKYKPRRMLIPFSGSGSEILGAINAGWEDIVGIDNNKEYVEIAEKRLFHHKIKMKGRA